jgi:hypothetical protein
MKKKTTSAGELKPLTPEDDFRQIYAKTTSSDLG